MKELNTSEKLQEAYTYLLNSHFEWKLTDKEFAEITILLEVSYFLNNHDRLFDFEYMITKEGLRIRDFKIDREEFLKSIPNQKYFLNSKVQNFLTYLIEIVASATVDSLTNFATDMFYNLPYGFHNYDANKDRKLYALYKDAQATGYTFPMFIGHVISEMIHIDFILLDELCSIRYPLNKKELYEFQGIPF